MINIDKSGLNTNKMRGKHITDILNSGKKAVFTVGAVSEKNNKQEKSQHFFINFNDYAFVLFFYVYWSLA